MSHCFVHDEAVKIGFYPKDMFVLLAKNRLVADWQLKNQKNARKFTVTFRYLKKLIERWFTQVKINISKKLVDLKKLDDEINMFESRSNQLAYLFMNQETMDSLVTNLEPFHIFRENNNGILSSYVGRKVYENKDLKFGEVEIR